MLPVRSTFADFGFVSVVITLLYWLDRKQPKNQYITAN